MSKDGWRWDDSFRKDGVRLLAMPDGTWLIITLGTFDEPAAVKLREIDQAYWTHAELAKVFGVTAGMIRKRFSRRSARAAVTQEITVELYWDLPEEEQHTSLGEFAVTDARIRQGLKVDAGTRRVYNEYMAYCQLSGRVMYWQGNRWHSRDRRAEDGPSPFVRC